MKSSYTKRALAFWLAVAMVATSAPMAFAREPDSVPAASTTTSSTPTVTDKIDGIELKKDGEVLSNAVTADGSTEVTLAIQAKKSGADVSDPSGLTYTLAGLVDGSGVSISGTDIKVSGKAKAGQYTVVCDQNQTVKASFTVQRNPAVATTINNIYVDQIEVSDTKFITIVAGSAAKQITANVSDQYGDQMPNAQLTFEVSGNEKVQVDNGRLVVNKTATAGDVTVTVKLGSVQATFKVKVEAAPAEDDEVQVSFKNLENIVYTGSGLAKDPEVTASDEGGSVTYTYYKKVNTRAAGAAIDKSEVKDVGTYHVVAKYVNGSKVGYVEDDFEITPKKVTVTAQLDTKIGKAYDGTTTMSSSLSGSDFDIAGKVDSDTLTLEVTNTGLAYPNADVGTYAVNVPIKLAGDDAKNYELSAATVSVPAEITKAEFTGTKEQSVSVLANKADTYTFDMPTDVAGLTDLSVSIGTGNSGDVVESATIRNNQLEIKTKSVASGKTQAVDVTVNSKNYQAFTVRYTLNVVDKTDVSNKITFTDKTETYKSGVSYQLSNPKIDLASATGKWTYTWSKDGVQTTSSGSETMPSFTEVGTYRVTATYEDDANLGRKTATLTIKPAAVKSTITVTATQMNSSKDDNYKYWDLEKRSSGDGYLNLRADADDYLVRQSVNGDRYYWIGLDITPKINGQECKVEDLYVSGSGKSDTWKRMGSLSNKECSIGDFYLDGISGNNFYLWFDTDGDSDNSDTIYLATDKNGSNKFELYVDFDSYSGSSSSSSGSSSSDTSKVDGDRVSTTTVDKTPSVKNGSATVTFSSSALSDALDENKKEAKREDADKTYIELDVKTSKSVDDTTITVPRSSLDKIADEDTGLKLTTNQGTVTFDYRALAEIYDACDKTNIEFYLEEEDDDQYVLLIKDGSSDVIDLGRGSVEVTFDYKLKSGEKSSDVKVYRIGNGDKTWLSTYGGSTVYGAADVYAAAPAYVTDMKADYSSSKKKVTFTTDALGTFLITTDTLKTGSGSTTTTPTYNAFVDVPSSRWSATYINKLASLGIINGTGGGYFEPTLYVTREEFVKMLAGVAGANVTGYTSSRFPDVPLSRWSAPYIAWAADRGITTGTDGGNFAPTMRITREEMATMIYRYVQSAGETLPAKNAPVIFADANLISGWAQTPVSVMQQAGIIDGNVTNGRYTFDPKVSASREECAKMLAVLYDLVR